MPFFQIVTVIPPPQPASGSAARKRWVYRQGTPKNPGDPVCQSAGSFDSEAECRSDIAEKRSLMKSAGFAKVQS